MTAFACCPLAYKLSGCLYVPESHFHLPSPAGRRHRGAAEALEQRHPEVCFSRARPLLIGSMGKRWHCGASACLPWAWVCNR